jgi:hypothetical protein
MQGGTVQGGGAPSKAVAPGKIVALGSKPAIPLFLMPRSR